MAFKSILTSPTSNLDKSRDFYSRLGFSILEDGETLLVSDGSMIMEINPDRYARAGVKLFKKNWSDEVGVLEKLTEVVSIKNGHILADPSGAWIYLMNTAGPVNDSENVKSSTLGNYAGICLETINMKLSGQIWKTLGFEQTMGSVEQGWVAFSKNDMTVSLMKPNACPHLFFNPSVSYFNGEQNPEIIRKIREAGVEIAEEITFFNKEGVVDNVILRDPGGFGFFIFND